MIPKFRCWDVANKKMFTNDELIIWNSNVYANDSGNLTVDKLKGWSVDDKFLMQSTGLFDKNGVEIFEGDVIGEGLLRGVVKYYSHLGMWVSELVKYNNYQKLKDVASGNEVIGNIYENPELVSHA